ncbi:MAG: hypothetical protein GY845_30420 [Planctomycetes bacterium]|nr:hypothetical protein [Planctomycetota bacterium]
MTNEEFQEWKAHPTTRKYYKLVEKLKRTTEESMGAGITLSIESASATQAQTAEVVGYIKGLNELLDVKFEEEEA